MKNITKIKKWIVPIAIGLLIVVSCNNDDDDDGGGNFNLAAVEASLEEARNLLSTTEEGIGPGDQQPGSKAILQSVIAAIERIISNADSQDDVNDAGVKIGAAIQTYLASVVSEAFPWVQQEDKTAISISSNIRPIIAGEFTIQGEFYIVNLSVRAFFNNMFALNGLPDSGFTVRYSQNGSTELLVGDGSWTSSPVSAPGVFKAGEWVNVAFTSTGSAQTLFVNGQEIVTMNKELLLPNPDDVTLKIGNSPVFSDRTSNLLAREFTIWNTVLTPDQIQANVTADFDGTEANLEAYFPLSSDLGNNFSDVTGNYTATLEGSVVWVAEPPVIILDFTALDAAITSLTTFIGTVVEGDQNGDFPVGTIAYLNSILTNANEVKGNAENQADIDAAATAATSSIDLANNNLVADAMGLAIDVNDPNAVGFRITPNYSPQGDYTYEFDVFLNTLLTPNNPTIGDVFFNGTMGFRINGYNQAQFDADASSAILNSGGGWNFTLVNGAFIGPMYDPVTLRPGAWYHVGIVHDDTARTTGIYVNGTLVSEATDISAPDISGAGEIWLGTSGSFKIDGLVKDFRIWNAVRTPAELNAEITGSEANLELYFPLDRVNGVSFDDVTGTYNGELRGVEWNTSQ